MALPSRTVADYACQLNWDTIESYLSKDREIVTSLPTTNLYTGRVIHYQAATGVVWQLRYNASATYKWEFIGGPPAISTSSTAQVITVITDDATVSVTLPAAGVYDVAFELAAFVNAANGYYEVYVNFAGTLGQTHQVLCPIAGNNSFYSVPIERRTASASGTCRLSLRPVGAATSMTLGYRILAMTPRSIG